MDGLDNTVTLAVVNVAMVMRDEGGLIGGLRWYALTGTRSRLYCGWHDYQMGHPADNWDRT